MRCKLRSLSPKRREDGGESWEVYSQVGSRPDLAPGCSANSSSVRPPPPPPLPPQPPGCQSAWLVWAKQAQAIGPRGQWNCCQLGQHFTAEHHSPNSAVGHKPRATWNLSLPAVHGWFTPQNPTRAKGLNVYSPSLKRLIRGVMTESLIRTMLYHQHIDVHVTISSLLMTPTFKLIS